MFHHGPGMLKRDGAKIARTREPKTGGIARSDEGVGGARRADDGRSRTPDGTGESAQGVTREGDGASPRAGRP